MRTGALAAPRVPGSQGVAHARYRVKRVPDTFEHWWEFQVIDTSDKNQEPIAVFWSAGMAQDIADLLNSGGYPKSR